MPIDIKQLVLMAREQLSELSSAVHFSEENLYALIRPAIAMWQEETNNDPQKRQSFIVESGKISPVAGVYDLSDAIDTYGFRLDWLKESDIEIAYDPAQAPEFTVKFVNSLDRLKMVGRQDKFFHLAYLSGTNLRMRKAGSTTADAMMDDIVIRSAAIPSDPSELNAGIMPELSTAIANLARREIMAENRGLNVPVT